MSTKPVSLKEDGFAEGLFVVFGGILMIIVAVNLIPTMASSILSAKNSASSVSNVDNSTALALNNSLAPIIPLYAIVPIVVVVGIVLGILATFSRSQ